MISPLNMLQEQQVGKPYAPWRILVCCILLNRTHGRQVRPMIDRLFGLCHEPRELLICANDPDIVQRDLLPLLTPLGFKNQRLRNLKAMSEVYATWANQDSEHFWKPPWHTDGHWASFLPGCGQYAVDSLNVFLYDKLEAVSSDTWLNDYITWKKQQ